jgi:hypothetical protein
MKKSHRKIKEKIFAEFKRLDAQYISVEVIKDQKPYWFLRIEFMVGELPKQVCIRMETNVATSRMGAIVQGWVDEYESNY